MNVQDAGFRSAVAEQTSEQFFLHRSSFPQRPMAAVTAAAAEAGAVAGVVGFAKGAMVPALPQKLLGVPMPHRCAGAGVSVSDITAMCCTLGRASASTAM